MKRCSGCEIYKPFNEFDKNNSKKDKLQNICKMCKSLYHKGFKKERKSLILASQGKKHCSLCNTIYTVDNFFSNKSMADQLSCYCKICTTKIIIKYESNKKIKYFCQDCDKELSRYGKFCIDCKKINIVEYRKNYSRKQRQNIEYRLKSNISRSVREALKLNGSSKRNRSISKYLPYTIEELKQHLESQFEPWMNWSNHGVYNPKTWNDNNSFTWTWNIDHIIPQCIFNYTSMSEQAFLDCWALSNLRPYSAKQNIKDGSRKMKRKCVTKYAA